MKNFINRNWMKIKKEKKKLINNNKHKKVREEEIQLKKQHNYLQIKMTVIIKNKKMIFFKFWIKKI